MPSKLADEILEAVPVRVGAHKLRDDLGAVDRGNGDAEIFLEHGDIEAGEVENLEHGQGPSAAL